MSSPFFTREKFSFDKTLLRRCNIDRIIKVLFDEGVRRSAEGEIELEPYRTALRSKTLCDENSKGDCYITGFLTGAIMMLDYLSLMYMPEEDETTEGDEDAEG